MLRVAALITCFNRRDITLRCLRALFANARESCELVVYLVDDGSSDGTSEAVRSEFPGVEIVKGNGNLYWNRGMRKAWEAALASRPDFYLWLNDDTELRQCALVDLLDLHHKLGRKAIVCGRIRDRHTGIVIYGGLLRANRAHSVFGLQTRWPWPKGHLDLAQDEDLIVDTMHGNCVLIPANATDDIGLISEYYWHSDGDTDYGFRASKAGYTIAQLSNPVASGEYNLEFDARRAYITPRNWKYVFTHPKGRRPVEAFHYYRQHIRPHWFARLVWSYFGKFRLK